jgi:hypothetical protein
MSWRAKIALLVIATIVIVPTIMRSRQHVDLRDSTRLSIRLNWQSDTPPHRALVSRDDASPWAVAPITLVEERHHEHVQPCPNVPADRIVQSPFDKTPDLYRGPPASSRV